MMKSETLKKKTKIMLYFLLMKTKLFLDYLLNNGIGIIQIIIGLKKEFSSNTQQQKEG
jgi:hypothetical protein